MVAHVFANSAGHLFIRELPIHPIVLESIATNAPAIAATSFVPFPAALLVSIANAAAVNCLVDRYSRRLRRKFRPRLAERAAVSTSENESRSGLTLMFKSLPKRRVVHLAVGLAVICAAELTARYMGFGEPPLVMLDDKIEYYLTPSRRYVRFGHDIRINRYSMRSDDVDMATVDRRSIFSLFGDSIVYGSRLDQADTIPAQLQKHLTVKGTGQRVLVNGIAASSWGPENLLEFYKRFGPFPGNTAWIVQSTHDMVDVIDLNEAVPYRTASPYGALHDLALSTWRATPRVLPSKPDLVTHEDKRRRADIALHALITVVKADYTRVTLVFHATRDEAIGGKADGLAHYRAVAHAQGINFISTMELYARAYESNLPPQYDEIHLSKDGAHMLSERLAADIDPLNSRN